KNGEGVKGEGGRAVLRAWGGMVRATTQSERTMKSEATTHAERAKSVVSRIIAKICSNFF
ncbi:hypothetical protein HYW73_01980, partial [Candidatus Nomurabacteria bacterium]|nr:hypothetical protein [Candidatus Nomurabacteria bacterium]